LTTTFAYGLEVDRQIVWIPRSEVWARTELEVARAGAPVYTEFEIPWWLAWKKGLLGLEVGTYDGTRPPSEG